MIIFDTDMSLGTPRAEIDDGAALIVLLRAMGERISAVTTVHGNTTLDNVVHNTQRLLAYLGREDIPIARGAAEPFVEDKAWFAAWQADYGQTEPWPDFSTLPLAATLMIDTIRAHPGQVTVIAVGPLTNLALALRMAPDIVNLVRELVIMGGSFGEVEATAEFNAHCDPEATHIVLQAGWPIRLLGLNITQQVLFRREAFVALPDNNRAVALLKQQAPGWIDRVEAMGWEIGGCALHDALAVAAVLDDSLFVWQETAVTVDLSPKPQRGIIRFQAQTQQPTSKRVAIQVDSQRCYQLIWHYLQNPSQFEVSN